MMDWTDRHCRFLHRLLTRRALLYTEMVVADAVLHGDRQKLLGFDAVEHPVALQLGGSEPELLAEAARIATDFGYDEVNLNVGCPSDRVQSGTFGACLMREPDLVARCVEAMKAATPLPVTVKCRIGVDEQDPEEALAALAEKVIRAGCDGLWVHARKAWLQGLSPKENRTVPPLDYDRVYRLKRALGQHFVGINGGIETLDAAQQHLEHCDGVMLGRAAYHNASLLADVDRRFFAAADRPVDWNFVCEAMMEHASRHMAGGGRLSHVTRHMVGLFSGQPGARRFRQILSTDVVRADAGVDVIRRAFAEVVPAAMAQPA
ncbi:tRNA dihydrouridine(20/20a) synthase DusA [Pseudohoeflea coraliihabitans]